jgi:Ca2+-dependent lipid-binding protein
MSFLLHVRCLEGKNLPAADKNGYSDPYVTLRVGQEKHKTKTVSKTVNPVFAEDFTFLVKDNKEPLIVEVWDHDKIKRDDLLSRRQFDMAELERAGKLTGWFDLQDGSGKPTPTRALHLVMAVDREVKNFKPKDHAWIAARSQLLEEEKKEAKSADDGFTLYIGS